MNIATNLKQLRHENNISQQQFADSLFVAQQSAANWETGKTLPQIDRICDIADKYDISVSQVIFNEIVDDPTDEVVCFRIDDSEKMLAMIETLQEKRRTVGLWPIERLDLMALESKRDRNEMCHYIGFSAFEWDTYKAMRRINPDYSIEEFNEHVLSGISKRNDEYVSPVISKRKFAD